MQRGMLELANPENFRSIMEGLPAGICILDHERKIQFWSDGAERITGYLRHEVVGHSSPDNILPHCEEHGCDLCGEACPFAAALREGKSRRSQVSFHHKDGHTITVEVRTAPIRSQHGHIIGVTESFEELRPTGQAGSPQDSLAAHGCLDEISGLPNREFTQFQASKNLASFDLYKLPFGILRIRVENAAQFVAAHGREAGNALLRLLRDTVRASIGLQHFLGRWADDEFLAVLGNVEFDGVEAIAHRVHELIKNIDLRWWGDNLIVHASLGYATVQTGDRLASLLSRAEPASSPWFSRKATTTAETNQNLEN